MISFLIRSPPGEGDLFLRTIRDQFLIEELPAIIGINAQNWERKEGSSALEGCQNCLSTAIQDGEAFGPSCRDVREGESIQVTSLSLHTTMSHQIRLEKAGLGLIPLLEGADRNVTFEQGARSRRGQRADLRR